eukprot:TRINITY_DN1470_c0_g1_i7.p1 TRINITY_DN1470_c0_g1~~TRINITY_DN1470_c0_g1_i7.p1  ORF type:complete len:121 (+),score=14.68 TRINITY_DN1470_c0_g1_i7:126-488(+)
MILQTTKKNPSNADFSSTDSSQNVRATPLAARGSSNTNAICNTAFGTRKPTGVVNLAEEPPNTDRTDLFSILSDNLNSTRIHKEHLVSNFCRGCQTTETRNRGETSVRQNHLIRDLKEEI